MQSIPVRAWAFALAVMSGLFTPRALAHGDLDIGGFYQGIATVVLHWEQALFLFVAGLWCAQQRANQGTYVGGALVAGLGLGLLATFAGLRIEYAMLAGAAAYSIVGLAVASQLRQSLLLSLPIALTAGVANGLALGSNEASEIAQPTLFSMGLLLGAGMLLFYVSSATRRLPAGWPWIGVRVAGSWAAAIGLMVSAFALMPAG